MSENKDVILKSRYRFKPEGSDRYVTLYFETSPDMIVADPETGKTLQDSLDEMKSVIDGFETTFVDLQTQLTTEVREEARRATEDLNTRFNDLSESIESTLEQKVDIPIFKTFAQLTTENPVLTSGQLGIETDKHRFKIGDGITVYTALKYLSGGGVSESYTEPLIGTAAYLASINSVLAEGQVAVETDTGKAKIGDGLTAYNSLEYANLNKVSNSVPVVGTRADLIATNALYAANRIIVETDTGLYKVGDGYSTYKELGYRNSSTSGGEDNPGTGDISSSNMAVIEKEETLSDLNPILDLGQVAVASDTSKVVIGDGVTPYNELTPLDSSDTTVLVETSETFEANNPVLKAGQIAVESDTGMYKIGDGTTPFNQLEYYTDADKYAGTYALASDKTQVSNSDGTPGEDIVSIGATTELTGETSDIYVEILGDTN